MIDVSEVLLSPEFAELVTVTRRREVVGSNGRTAITGTPVRDVPAVVQPASGNDLDRLPEYQAGRRYMTVLTTFRLQGPRPGLQPDLVTWRGDSFVVVTCDPWMSGSGYVKALVSSMDSVEAAL